VGLKGKCLALPQKGRWSVVEHGGIFNAEILEATEQDEQQNLWVERCTRMLIPMGRAESHESR
jgi:hypothetical protein